MFLYMLTITFLELKYNICYFVDIIDYLLTKYLIILFEIKMMSGYNGRREMDVKNVEFKKGNKNL